MCVCLFALRKAEPYSKSLYVKHRRADRCWQCSSSLIISVTLALHSESFSQNVFAPEIKLLKYIG